MGIKPMVIFLIHYSYYFYHNNTCYNVGMSTDMNIPLWQLLNKFTQKQGFYMDTLDGLKRRAENMLGTR